jgi:hypothetical protein
MVTTTCMEMTMNNVVETKTNGTKASEPRPGRLTQSLVAECEKKILDALGLWSEDARLSEILSSFAEDLEDVVAGMPDEGPSFLVGRFAARAHVVQAFAERREVAIAYETRALEARVEELEKYLVGDLRPKAVVDEILARRGDLFGVDDPKERAIWEDEAAEDAKPTKRKTAKRAKAGAR